MERTKKKKNPRKGKPDFFDVAKKGTPSKQGKKEERKQSWSFFLKEYKRQNINCECQKEDYQS